MSGQRGFVMVPAWLLLKKPTGNDVLVYCTLGSHGTWNPGAGVYESCKPAIETIADETGLSRSTVKRSINNLLGFNALQRTLQYTPEGDPAPSLYCVIFGQVVEPDGVGSQVTRPPVTRRKSRSKGGRSTGEPTSVQPRTDPRSTGEPRVGSPVDRNQEPLNQDPMTHSSVPAAQVRPGQHDCGPDGGQITIDGSVEAVSGGPTQEDTAFGIANAWIKYRAGNNCPIGGDRVEHRLKSLVLPFLKTDYTEREIKKALNGLDEGIPSRAALQRALDTIRQNGAPGAGGRPQGGRGGPMAGTNRHMDDVTAEERQARNPLLNAVVGSQVAGRSNDEQREPAA